MFLPKRLVFSGGGTRCLVFLPALRILHQQKRLTNVSEWWGTSAGALLATLCSITRSVDRVSEIMETTTYSKFRDVSLVNMVNFTSTWGLDDGHSMTEELTRVLELAQTGASSMTLSDISGLHIVVADLNIYETVVCSAKTFPTLKVVDALRASMSLPFFYRPVRSPVNGHLWIDGGLRAAFPWNMVPREARKEALGFAFERPWIQGPTTLTQYLFSMMHFEDPKIIHEYKRNYNNILWFASPPFPAWYVRIQPDDLVLLNQLGTSTVNDWITRHSAAESSKKHPLSEDPDTPSPVSPPHHTNELSESRPPCSEPCQAPSRGSQSHTALTRRWSL
jgi:predicted acylesterase/phospholipase RssA